MAHIGSCVVYLIMACAILGAFASLRNSDSGLGKEFLDGLHSIGPIFVPVAGIMASIPYLSKAISLVFGPLFDKVGADPAIAATTFIAVDMGGYQLADVLAASREGWIMAMIIGYMAGATIVFSIPVGLTMLKQEDHKYMALGVMAGILSVPVGTLVSCSTLAFLNIPVRQTIDAATPSTYTLALTFSSIFTNLAPLIFICGVIALGLRFLPDLMIRLFLLFGKAMTAGVRLVLVFSIVEYFTRFFSNYLGGWGFDPIIADAKDLFRALEISGYIGIMLAGAFPLIYLIKKYLAHFVSLIGKKIGMESTGAAGLLAASANILALFHLIEEMSPKDKVLCIAFAVCSAFLFGDHLAFTANFQPNLILPVLLGKLVGGLCGFGLAYLLSVSKAVTLSEQDKKEVKIAAIAGASV